MIYIFGYGTVGNAVHFRLKNSGHKIKIIDPRLGYDVVFESSTRKDFAIICVNTPHCEVGYNTENIVNVLERLKKNEFKGLVLIKSTISPEQALLLKHVYKGLDIAEWPEFLNERTANSDIFGGKIIMGGTTEQGIRLTKLLDQNVRVCKYGDAMKVKIVYNILNALEISFWHSLFVQTNWDIREISELWSYKSEKEPLSKIYQDGTYGYGGKCLPKDVKAFVSLFDEPIMKFVDNLNDSRSSKIS